MKSFRFNIEFVTHPLEKELDFLDHVATFDRSSVEAFIAETDAEDLVALKQKGCRCGGDDCRSLLLIANPSEKLKEFNDGLRRKYADRSIQ